MSMLEEFVNSASKYKKRSGGDITEPIAKKTKVKLTKPDESMKKLFTAKRYDRYV